MRAVLCGAKRAVINLMMAGLWVVLGVFVLVWQRLHPGQAPWTIWGTDLSIAWLAFPLAGYNVMRWWSGRALARERRVYREAEEQRRRSSRKRAGQGEEEREPNFDFTQEPPECL